MKDRLQLKKTFRSFRSLGLLTSERGWRQKSSCSNVLLLSLENISRNENRWERQDNNSGLD